MEKKIQLKDGVLLVKVDPNDYVQYTTIKKAYIDNGILKGIITFSMWDDFEFDAYSSEEVNELSFLFDDHDPLYLHLNKLLGDKEKIVIDDDQTFNKLEKFMTIERIGENIVVHFVSNGNCELIHQKFSVFIKNTGPDARSKIQNSDLKIRLIDFFRNCESSLLTEEYQSSEENGIESKKNLIYRKGSDKNGQQ